MKIKWFALLGGVTAVAVSPAIVTADPEPNPEIIEEVNPFDTDTEADVQELVAQLAADDFSIREAAMKELWKLGSDSLPALEGIAEGKDPEAADRASELLLYIGAGVLHDSPEDIKKMVLEYSRTTMEKKLGILRKLTEQGHWRQVLHLANMEKVERTKKRIFEIVQKYAGDAARKALAVGDMDLVGEIIELLGDSDQALVMRAWYYKQRGQLAAQMQEAEKTPGKEGSRWRLALHRADGNIAGALKEAKALGDARLVAAFQLLQGDPIPWLLADTPTKVKLDPIIEMARRIQIAKLRGENKKAGIMARELDQMARSSSTNHRVISALAGTGFRDMAIDLMVRREPLTAFGYFDNMESPEKALKILGIPNDASAPYSEWVKKTTAEALEDEEYLTYSKLMMLASFLVRHGEGEHALAVVKPLMDALEEDGSDVWFDLIYSMSIYDLGKEVLHFVEKRGNEDGEADKAVKKIFRNVSEGSVVDIWKALQKRNDQKLDKSLHQIAILSGLLEDADNEVAALEKELLAAAKEDKDVDETARFSAVFAFALTRGDMETCLKMSNEKAAGSPTWLKAKRYYDKELFNWAEMQAYYEDLVKKEPGNYRSAVYLYIALRKQGKEAKTKGMMERIRMLSMGDAGVLSAVASEFYKVGFYKEATELWIQTLVMAEPGKSHFDAAVVALSENPQHLYDSEQWKRSAAFAEVHVELLLRGTSDASINDMLRTRFRVELARGMHQLKNGDRKQALVTLDTARKLVPGDGTLADHFFPLLSKAEIGKTYDQWFEESYRHVEKAAKRYPGSHNTHNTAAWLCSRSVRKLDEAERHSAKALKIRPHQGAYLDTMAEVWFARGNREKAVEWSQKAVDASRRLPQSVFRMRKFVFLNYQQLQLQFDRFSNDPMPTAKALD
ncbi:MAG: tetratricopeptide repeat protein [Akkermansiaceae bacterium]